MILLYCIDFLLLTDVSVTSLSIRLPCWAIDRHLVRCPSEAVYLSKWIAYITVCGLRQPQPLLGRSHGDSHNRRCPNGRKTNLEDTPLSTTPKMPRGLLWQREHSMCCSSDIRYLWPTYCASYVPFGCRVSEEFPAAANEQVHSSQGHPFSLAHIRVSS